MPKPIQLDFAALASQEEPPLHDSPGEGPVTSDEHAPLSQTLGPVLNPSLRQLFRRMEVAEDEIQLAKHRAPSLREQFHRSFRHLQPTPVLSDFSDTLYRAHVRQLLDRVGEGSDLRPGTKAEVLAGLALVSETAPLNATGYLLYCRLFRELMPDATTHHTAAPHAREGFCEEEADRMLDRARNRLVSNRGFDP